MNLKKEQVAVVGLGYVGLPLAILASKRGYKVTGIVKNPKSAKLINSGVCPFGDKSLEKDLKKYPIPTTSNFIKIKDSDIIVICVPTPVFENGRPDLTPIKDAGKSIGRYLKNGQLIILESTVNPGLTETVLIPLLEKASHLKAGLDFHISHCPERINPGDKKWTVENIPRVVGSFEKAGLKKTINFYKSILSAKVFAMENIREAEAVKIVENCFRDINIAFTNELAMSFSHLGIDITHVLKGASTKPFAFMPHYPGVGVGGHCIPVDPNYLISYAHQSGFEHKFLTLARKINKSMPQYTVDLLNIALKKKNMFKNDTVVTVLGLSYKPNIGDLRESPALEVISILKKQGYKVRTYDPYVKSSTEKDLKHALSNTHAIIVATAHNEFLKLKPNDFKCNIIIDGRNCLNKTDFLNSPIEYYGIGR